MSDTVDSGNRRGGRRLPASSFPSLRSGYGAAVFPTWLAGGLDAGRDLLRPERLEERPGRSLPCHDRHITEGRVAVLVEVVGSDRAVDLRGSDPLQERRTLLEGAALEGSGRLRLEHRVEHDVGIV